MRFIYSIDTVKFLIPNISDETIKKVESIGQKIIKVDMPTGTTIWEFTTGELKGSYDRRIRLIPHREWWEYDERLKKPILVKLKEGNYLIEIEFSLPKVLFGVNYITYGHFLDALASFKIGLERCLENSLHNLCHDEEKESCKVSLPGIYHWGIKRIDLAINFDVGNNEVVKEFLHHMWVREYPRRKVRNYEGTLYFPGYSSTIKIYNKFEEFKKHDRNDWKKYLEKKFRFGGEEILNRLEEGCKGLIRLEIELKQRLLYLLKKKDEHLYRSGKKWYTVDDIFVGKKVDLEKEFTDQLKKLFMNTESTSLSKNQDVEKRLSGLYGAEHGTKLYGIWVKLVTLGEKIARNGVADRTWRKYKKQLKEAGISLISTDLEIINIKTKYSWPEDFNILDISEKNSYIQKSMNIDEAMDFVPNIIREVIGTNGNQEKCLHIVG